MRVQLRALEQGGRGKTVRTEDPGLGLELRRPREDPGQGLPLVCPGEHKGAGATGKHGLVGACPSPGPYGPPAPLISCPQHLRLGRPWSHCLGPGIRRPHQAGIFKTIWDKMR